MKKIFTILFWVILVISDISNMALAVMYYNWFVVAGTLIAVAIGNFIAIYVCKTLRLID